MNRSVRLFFIGAMAAFLIATSLSGCVIQSETRVRERAAYLAGQRDELASMTTAQHADNTVFIVGPVEKSEVPWVEGLTLAQAIATANYTGSNNPKEITITRNGESASIDPKDLLTGHVVPLEAGDTITIHEQ